MGRDIKDVIADAKQLEHSMQASARLLREKTYDKIWRVEYASDASSGAVAAFLISVAALVLATYVWWRLP